jgi:methyl-accepting chemotaxis protein
MSSVVVQDRKRVGIIGGGKRGMELYTLFSHSSSTRVSFVVDVNANAPAVQAARKDGVRSFNRVEDIQSVPVDFLFEVTGRPEVAAALTAMAGQLSSKLITHDMAKVVLEVIEENDHRSKSRSIHEISDIKGEITGHLDRLGRLVEDIETITSGVNMLAINARIEAARVGELGRGFGVVATEMGKSAVSIKKITDEIERINSAIGQTSNRIDAALKRLE